MKIDWGELGWVGLFALIATAFFVLFLLWWTVGLLTGGQYMPHLYP